VAHITLVHINRLDLPAGQGLGLLQHPPQCAAAVGIAGQGLGMRDELAAFAALAGRRRRDFHAELMGLVRLTFGDAFVLRGVS